MAKECPECTFEGTGVIDSRPTHFSGWVATRRRRKCPSCGYKFTTYEISEAHFHAMSARHTADLKTKVTGQIIDTYFKKHAGAIFDSIQEYLAK